MSENGLAGDAEIVGEDVALEKLLRTPIAVGAGELLRRWLNINFPRNRRAGMALKESLGRHDHLLGILRIRLHPGVAARKPGVGGIANADEAEPLGLVQRGETRRPQFARREWRRVVGAVE